MQKRAKQNILPLTLSSVFGLPCVCQLHRYFWQVSDTVACSSNTHTNTHTYMHTHRHTHIRRNARAHTHTYMRARASACLLACLPATRMPPYYIQTHIHPQRVNDIYMLIKWERVKNTAFFLLTTIPLKKIFFKVSRLLLIIRISKVVSLQGRLRF